MAPPQPGTGSVSAGSGRVSPIREYHSGLSRESQAALGSRRGWGFSSTASPAAGSPGSSLHLGSLRLGCVTAGTGRGPSEKALR